MFFKHVVKFLLVYEAQAIGRSDAIWRVWSGIGQTQCYQANLSKLSQCTTYSGTSSTASFKVNEYRCPYVDLILLSKRTV